MIPLYNVTSAILSKEWIHAVGAGCNLPGNDRAEEEGSCNIWPDQHTRSNERRRPLDVPAPALQTHRRVYKNATRSNPTEKVPILDRCQHLRWRHSVTVTGTG